MGDILLPMFSVLDSGSRGLGSRPAWVGTGELLGKPDEMQGGEPCDGLVSYPGESCYYPHGFMLRKQGQPPARRGH